MRFTVGRVIRPGVPAAAGVDHDHRVSSDHRGSPREQEVIVSVPAFAPRNPALHRPGAIGSVLADAIPGALVRDIALVAGGAGLTGLAAQFVLPIPGTPVPITGQTFGALLVGAALGWRRGAAAMLLYLLAGAVGVPWFNGGSAGLTGASAGYIVGFVLAGGLVGALAARGGDRTPVRTAGTMLLGNVAIYAIGVPWLMASAGVGIGAGLAMGVVPFLLGDLVKVVLAAGLLPGAWALVNRVRRNETTRSE